ncbi:MAG TPA: N-6 DNA methylase, partial [Agitococcus sp.]|nr:N-6 DNA methylase [Agitococcus sp.]
MTLFEQGLTQKLIEISEDKSTITYLYQGKSRNYNNPEEKVQAEAFLKLVLEHGYPVENIKQFVSVTIGSDKREADIVVYDDTTHQKPIIIVEAKKNDVTQAEFNQAIHQCFSYANALAGTVKYIWVYSGLLSEVFRFDKEKNQRQELTDLPHYGSDTVAPYNFVKGGGKHEYIDNKGKKQTQEFKDIKTVGQDELTKRFKQAHDALWAGGQLNPSEAFDELDKLIFCKIWDERYNLEGQSLKRRKKGEIYDFQVITVQGYNNEDSTQKTNTALATRIKKIYARGKNFDKEVFKDDIRLSNERIRTIVNYLQEINLSETDLDSKGRAFETFMGSFFRGEFGQYFTPRPIVKFIVDVLPIKNTHRVLDTSCGSGGFLLHALDKVRKQADNEYPDFETDREDYRDWHDYWHNFAEKNLFGIEINEQIARTAKMNMIIHDDGHTNVVASDGLLTAETIAEKSENKGFKNESFDFIITNPPFGSAIKLTEQAYLKNYRLAHNEPSWLDLKNTAVKGRDSQSTEVLFIEQAHNFLKVGGYLAIVIPDGILTNSSLQSVRDDIEEHFRIVAVVSMPQTAFSATGAGVKSSVLFLKKYSEQETDHIQKTKIHLQNNIKYENLYEKFVMDIEKEKALKVKNLTGFDNPYREDMPLKLLKATEEYKEWKSELDAEYREKINEVKEKLEDFYLQQKQQKLPDYPIFMAIAEDIGYDATGKSTKNNELDVIGQELAKFILEVEQDDNMGKFELSLYVDTNNVFIVNKNDTLDRLDPYFFKPEFMQWRKRFLKLNFKPLKNYILSWNRGDGPRDGYYCDDEEDGVPFIRINNIKNHSINMNGIKYIHREIHNTKLKRTKVKPNDLIFAISGTKDNLGTLAIIPNDLKEANLNSALVRLDLSMDLNPEFLCILFELNFIRIQIEYIGKGAAQNNLNNKEIGSIFIPNLSKKEQKEIIKIYKDAFSKKQNKTNESVNKLKEIDLYLLNALGIELPQQDNSLKSRIFIRKSNEILSSRLDPDYFS